jgi:hypothetical protein
MDRYDERKPGRDTDDDRHAGVGVPGDVLGLGRGPAPKSPGDPSAAEERGRHDHVTGGDEQPRTGDRNLRRGTGATGIDMGAGGSGTDVTGE